MKICSNCGHNNAEGILFCERCGVAIGAISLSTKQLSEEENNLQAGGELLGEENIIFIYVRGHEDPITVQLRDHVILGRGDGKTGENAVNLDPFGAADSGVSRRHAILQRDGEHLQIIDLGSTNHTYVNGEQVDTTLASLLRDGDEVQLGRLTMRVFFK
jgi:hypothetical protein